MTLRALDHEIRLMVVIVEPENFGIIFQSILWVYTATFNEETGQAYWFSKNIIPLIRGEETLRTTTALSPVLRHLGLYAFHIEALRKFVSLPESHYEKTEGLEQLRLLENGISIHAELVASEALPPLPGIDTPEDLARAELYLKEKR